MSVQKKPERDLEIQQDPAFQQREWAIQRFCWTVMGVAILAALAGAFGDGPIARADTASPDGNLRVHYDRIARYDALTELQISVRGAGLRSEKARVWVDREYVEDMTIRQILPEPDSVTTDANRIHFVFGVGPDADSAGIHIQLQPTSIGANGGSIGVESGAGVFLRQYVLP